RVGRARAGEVQQDRPGCGRGGGSGGGLHQLRDAHLERPADRGEHLAGGILAAALHIREVLHAHTRLCGDVSEGAALLLTATAQRVAEEFSQQGLQRGHGMTVRRRRSAGEELCCRRNDERRHADFFFFVPLFFVPPDVFVVREDLVAPDELFAPEPLVPSASSPRRLRTLRSRASMRLSTLPPSSASSSASSPKVASVSTVSPSSSFASRSRRSSAWYSSVNFSGRKSSLNCSTSAADIFISFAEIFDLEGAKSTSLRSVGQRRVCSASR